MAKNIIDPFGARDTFATSAGQVGIYRLARLEKLGLCQLASCRFRSACCWKRCCGIATAIEVTEEDVQEPGRLERRGSRRRSRFRSSRPASCCRTSPACRAWSIWPRCASAMKRLGGDPKKINPLIPVDLVIDHSVQVDRFGTADALDRTSSWSSSATASATSSCAGDRRRSTTSASCRRPWASCTR